MATASANRSVQYSPRVGAWIVSVVNPAIDSLRSEAALLAKGNISWRYFSKQCEYIRPVRQYIEGNYRPNYDDFLLDNPRFKKRFQEHDLGLSRVEDAAGKFAAELLHNEKFTFAVEKALADYKQESTYPRSPGEALPPSLEGMKPGLSETIAEYLINNVESLPRHHMPHDFWEQFRERFIRDFSPQKASKTTALLRAVKQLAGISDSLAEDLVRHRLNLCRKYDIPPVPTPSQSPLEDVLSHR